MKMPMDLTEVKLRRKDVFEGKIMTVHVDDVRLPNGEEATREVVDHVDGAAVLALDEANRVLVVRQYRYVFGKVLDELPAGFAVPEGRVKPWGTCHAVLAAKDLIDGPFAVINADDYYGPEAFRVMYDYLSTHEDGSYYDYCMVSYLLRNTVSENGSVARGVCVTEPDGTLHSVTERTRIETYENGVHFTEDGGASWTDPARRYPGEHEPVGLWQKLSG